MTWTLPKSAVIDEAVKGVRNRKQYVIRTKLGERITFYVPIANARSPRLADYSFDVLAELKQEQFGNAEVQRFVHVDIPKPRLELAIEDATKVVDSVPACGAKKPVYQVKYTPHVKGLLGKPGDPRGAPTLTLDMKVVSQSTFETLSSKPISVCYGDTVKITATGVDPQGVESVTTVKTLRSPRFITGAKIAPDLRMRGTPVVIPATHSGEKPFQTTVFRQVRLTTDPRDVSDGSIPLATALKPAVNIAWTDLQYLDRETRTWVAVEIGKRGVVKASYEQGRRKNDTLVLEFSDTSWPTVFAGKLTVTDRWGRTITEDIRGANGKLPPPPTPNGIAQLLVEAGFQLGGDPEPIEGLPNSLLPGEGVAELSGLVRRLSHAYVKHDQTSIAALRATVRTFAATTAKTKVAPTKIPSTLGQ